MYGSRNANIRNTAKLKLFNLYVFFSHTANSFNDDSIIKKEHNLSLISN